MYSMSEREMSASPAHPVNINWGWSLLSSSSPASLFTETDFLRSSWEQSKRTYLVPSLKVPAGEDELVCGGGSKNRGESFLEEEIHCIGSTLKQ